MAASSENAVTTMARLSSDAATARRLADLLAESLADAAVATFGNTGGRWTVELHFVEAPDETAVHGLVTQIAGAEVARTLAFETVAPRDWVAASLAALRPVAAGRFLVHGAHDRAHVSPYRVGIEIEAALAFGTGHHGTTRGCLLALDALLRRGRFRRTASSPLLRKRGREKILDIGTGTGVLAIAAAKALRRQVVASDIDPRAVAVARANARANRVGALVEVVRAGGVTARRLRRGAPYDLVFANILLAPLLRLAAPMATLLAPNARVILSGLLLPQANAALAAYRAQGLTLKRRIHLDEWATLVLTREARRQREHAKKIVGRALGG